MSNSKQHVYTDTDDRYILDHYHKLPPLEIAQAIGVSVCALMKRAQTLQREGRECKHKGKSWGKTEPSEREIIRDGYDNVPWWCRQSTRRQVFKPQMYDAAYYADQRKEKRKRGDIDILSESAI
jgi:hypothetical protein